MTVRRYKTERGFTLVEVMIAVGILITALIGTSAYNYHSSLRNRKANLYENGIRMTLLLCEGWAGTDGSLAFDPVATFGSELNITADSGPACPDGYTPLGSYKIVLEDCNYYATLSWKNINSNVKALNIKVTWNHIGCGTGTLADANKTYELTSYVLI